MRKVSSNAKLNNIDCYHPTTKPSTTKLQLLEEKDGASAAWREDERETKLVKKELTGPFVTITASLDLRSSLAQIGCPWH